MIPEYELTTAQEEKAVLGKIGRQFDTAEKQKRLYAYRLQHVIANKILFSNLWQYPELLIELVKHTGLSNDATVKHYLTLLTK